MTVRPSPNPPLPLDLGVPSTARGIVLCADDYALAPGVSAAILALIDAGRLSATGAMTLSRFWPQHAEDLAERGGRADIGVHLTLTDQVPLGPMPLLAPEGRLPGLGRLIGLSLTGRLQTPAAQAEIAAELDRQVEAFAVRTGRAPDFLDGHQHAHQLRGIRHLVVEIAERRLAPGGYLRVCCDPPGRILRRPAPLRALVIDALGRGFRRLVRRRGVPANDSFRGVRNFRPDEPLPDLFRRGLLGPGERPLMMCHPGHVDADLAKVDPVTGPRQGEYDFLAGQDFPALLRHTGRRPARFADLPPSSPESPGS